MLTDFITSVSSHLARKRTADTFLTFLTNSSSMVIVFLNELSTAFETTDLTAAPDQTVSRYLELFPESSLANVLADQQQRKKLNMIADDILSNFLDQKAYSCYVLRDFLREVLAGVIFESMMSNFSRPEFINGWIIYLLSEGESEIMNAIDAGVEGARSQGVTARKGSDVKNTSDMNTAVSAEVDPQVLPQTTGEQSNHSDKATEEAIKEAKRLSAMIAAQDAQGKDLQQVINEARRDPIPHGADDSSFAEALDQVEDSVNKDDKHMLEMSEFLSHRKQRRLSSSPSVPSSSQSNTFIPEDIQGPTLTLYGASVSVDVELEPGEKTIIRSKPTSNYLIQVEPASTRCSGWMTFKKYADFESLHDTLEAISRLNKLWGFTEMHPALPTWKGHTRQALAQDLARYLKDALQHRPLAESEKMKRFLDKDNRLGTDPAESSTRTGFSFPSQATFENMGKGVLDALANAPKGVAGGSKAVLGGMTGVFGNVGGNGKRSSRSFAEQTRDFESNELFPAELEQARNSKYSESREISLDLTSSSNHTSPAQFTERQDPSTTRNSCSSYSSSNSACLSQNARSDEAVSGAASLAAVGLNEGANLLSSKACPSNESPSDEHEKKEDSAMAPQYRQAEATDSHKQPTADVKTAKESVDEAITNDETQIAVELIFAVINELYTLSSAWNIRRTLLNAAKSYILRPGSPTLETIRVSLQDSIINANTSDETIGAYLTKLRENALPTETEMKSWPPPPTEDEKERLRENARKLLVQRGLPQALTSVMGAVASREALEKIFDCLQVETIARGFVFTILLQVLRAVII